jgi:sugar/nucleoside kinase (ribokinase family)
MLSLQDVTNRLQERANADVVYVKLGAEGMVVKTAPPEVKTDSLLAMNPNPVGVAGAGDALLACSTLALTTGATA